MRKKKMSLVLLLVAVALSIACISCKNENPAELEVKEVAAQEVVVADTSDAPAKTKELNIGYVSMMMAADSNSRAYDAFKKESDARGWNLYMTDAAGDIVKVSEGLMNYVSQQVDVIVVTCAEITPIQEGLDAAKRAGIPVFSMDSGIDKDGAVIANVTSNCWAMGAEVASQIVDYLHGEGNVCIIEMPTLYVHRYRADAARGVFNSDDNKGINILDTEAVTVANWETGSYDVMTAWLTKYGNEIDAVLGTWDGIGWSVAKAVEDAGFTKDDIFTMCIDGTSQTYDMIRNGQPFVSVAAQNFGGWAEKTVDLIDQIVVQGKAVEEAVPQSRVVYIPHKWIDSTNVPPKGASPASVFN